MRDLKSFKAEELEARLAEVRAEEQARAERKATWRVQFEERKARAASDPTPLCDAIGTETPEERAKRRALESEFHVDRSGAGQIQWRIAEVYERSVREWLEGAELTPEERKAARLLEERTLRYIYRRLVDELVVLSRTGAEFLANETRDRCAVFVIANRTADCPVHLTEYWAEYHFETFDRPRLTGEHLANGTRTLEAVSTSVVAIAKTLAGRKQ